MVRKVCPICDQVMQQPHYCKNCKSWVKHPYVHEANYYLNERHPADEIDCSYHGGLDSGAAPKQRNNGKDGGWVLRKSENPNRPAQPATPKRNIRVGSRNKGVLVVVVILAAIRLLSSCVSMGVEAITANSSRTPEAEYDVDLGGFYGEDETWDAGYTQLEDEEVIAAGVACSRAAHFTIPRGELGEPVIAILANHNLTVTDESTYSYNEKYQTGETWYETWTSYTLNDGENGAYQYLELDCDTATGELHEISIALVDSGVLADVSGDIIELLEERGALQPGENCAELVRMDMPEQVAQGNGYKIQSGTLYVEGISMEDSNIAYIFRVLE